METVKLTIDGIEVEVPKGASVFEAAMSSLDSAINALSSSAVMDIYKPFIRPGASEKHYL